MQSKIQVPSIEQLEEQDRGGERALVRVDYNVPLDEEGEVASNYRIRASVPTIYKLLSWGISPVLISHMGRPGGSPDPELSLRPCASELEKELREYADQRYGVQAEISVNFHNGCIGEDAVELTDGMDDGEVLLLENLRFHPGERENDKEFVQQLAKNGDVYVNDAFSACHREHASITGLPGVLRGFAGLRLVEEIDRLHGISTDPDHPFAVVLGGAKIADKLPVLERLIDLSDIILFGGAMANTFLAARGRDMQESLVEEEMLEKAEALIERCLDEDTRLVLPQDLVVADSPESTDTDIVDAGEIPAGKGAYDVGPSSISLYQRHLKKAASVFWNGPLGVVENDSFINATRSIGFELVMQEETEVVIGGGDTGAALIDHLPERRMNREGFFISTGGGAALELVSGEQLPGITAISRQ